MFTAVMITVTKSGLRGDLNWVGERSLLSVAIALIGLTSASYIGISSVEQAIA